MMTAEPGFDVLAAWRAGELPADEAAGVEDHVFACDACGARVAWLEGVAAGVREALLAGHGFVACDEATLARLRRDGLVLREYVARPGERVPCTVGADDDLVVTRLEAELAGVERVDLALVDPGGNDHGARDVPVDARAGQIVYVMAGRQLRRFPDLVLECRLSADGRTLAEYTFAHTGFRGK